MREEDTTLLYKDT